VILTDELIDRVHHIQTKVLGSIADGFSISHPEVKGGAIGTSYALFAGEGSPMTQVSGFAHRTPGDLKEIDAFYEGLSENWELTITPFTHIETVKAMAEHGYRPDHFEAALAQIVDKLPDCPDHEILEVEPGDPRWSVASWRGWTENEDPSAEPDEFSRLMDSIPSRWYLAFVDGVPAAAASMMDFDEGVSLAGASTRVPFRGRGLQSALLKRRLEDAGKGRLALMGAVPGSASHRNAQRVGFVPLFSSLVWMRK